MPNRAKDIRDKTQNRHPGATVSRRGKKDIEFDLPDGRKHIVTSVGELHHDDGREINTDWMPAAGPFDYQAEIYGPDGPYSVLLSARSDVSAAPVVQWEDWETGETVEFYPHALQWTNDLDQIEQIGMPSGTTTPTGNAMRWVDAYGPGLDLEWFAHPTKLIKHLTVAALGSLGAVPQFIRDGGNPQLELNFGLVLSSGVELWIDGAEWNRKTRTDTADAVEARLPNGDVVWAFRAPQAWSVNPDDPGDPVPGSMRFKKQGRNLFVSVRFPLSWLESAQFPVIIDPTVNPAVTASGDDWRIIDPSSFYNNSTFVLIGQNLGKDHDSGIRVVLNVPNAATIDSADLDLVANGTYSSTIVSPSIYCNDADNPAAPTTYSGHTGLALTSGSAWNGIGSWTDGTTYTSIDFASDVQTVVDRAGWASGNNIIVVINDVSSSYTAFRRYSQYDHSTHNPPQLNVTYTAAAAGAPFRPQKRPPTTVRM